MPSLTLRPGSTSPPPWTGSAWISPVIITRNRDQAVVMLSLDDYEALEETAHLLRSPRNATRLLEAIHDLESGKGVVRAIDLES